MDAEVKQQQALMRSLHVFVDALRDVKKTEDATTTDRDVVEAVRVLCNPSDDQNAPAGDLQWHNEIWRRGLVPTFQRLCACMTRLDEFEVQSKKKMGPKTMRQAERPTAPAGLLSLRDYSVLQAAVEMLYCWGVYPRVASGVLLPIDKRRPTKTLEISKDVLMWGDREYNSSDEAVKKEEGDTINELLNITQALLHLLSLPQFQPILLPKYVVELLALLVYGEVAAEASTPVQTEFVRLREMVLRVLPLRMSMSSLRAALGQATPLLMENGGIVATIEMLLGAVEEGNTQARMQVATLICQCPSGEKSEKYVSALCTQVRDLLIAAVTPEKGPSVLRSANAVLQCIGTVLATYTAPITKLVDKEQQDGGLVRPLEEAEGEEEGDEILTICLGVVMTILEAGSAHRKESEEQQLRAMLPVLENLSHNPRPEVAELASNARAQILSRDAVDRANSAINNERGQSFEEVLWEAEQDLSSKLVPLRARGVVSLTKLVRRSHSHANDVEWTPRVHALAGVFLVQLHDAESYVFLAAVQGLAALADTHADIAIPALVKALSDSSSTLETRIKLSEALLFSAKRCGETLPKFAKLFVYAYLDCIRPPPSKRKHVERIQAEASRRVQLIQEVRGTEELDAHAEAENSEDGHESEEELLAAATLRASCLSNLAEVCALLQWGLQPFLLDVLTCVFGVLQVELELEAKHKPYLQRASVDAKEDEQHKLKAHKEEENQQRVVAVRRGAVFVLRYLVELLGWKILELMPDQLKPLYHTLKHVVRVDQDRVVVFHANRALTALGDVMRAELFLRVEEQDAALGISSLRII
ncbi:hypothetical protein BBJ29_003334 [Phytophthora kernoviae]|uniref:RNA polymerase II assembly factor Rtp1 C-terminal domain-containing protein n=1 Tax=Phytophthora kernoviae TaxID=325452 RepID=A0A3F2RMA9_9STRA|nr:hypothetical protein BBJ29_003334 [Phytophthora kernoviae]RLN60416.1 hypothetical protein BBP00_00006006 [Phytophthora kernoviae]